MNPEQLKKLNEVGQKFANQMLVNHAKESFLIGILSGGEAESYVLTPSHAKGLLGALSSHIDAYEKQFGTIDMTPSLLPSPFQGADLNK
jgi:hypothetical protein